MTTLGATISTSQIPSEATIAVTPGANITITIPAGPHILYTKWTAAEAEAVTCSGAQAAGTLLVVQVLNDGVLPRVITFNTPLITTGAVTGAVNKVSTILFVSDGTLFYETSRSVAL